MAHARPNSPSRARARARRLQTHGASRAKQYEEWSQLIRNYCKAKKLFVISVNDASTGDLFCNREIGRALPQASIVELLEQLVSEGYAEWEGGGKEQCVVYWRKPSEWAELIAARVRPATRAPDAPAPVPPLSRPLPRMRQVVEMGLEGQIFTLYDLIHGDFSESTDMAEMDERVLTKALEILQDRDPSAARPHGTPRRPRRRVADQPACVAQAKSGADGG